MDRISSIVEMVGDDFPWWETISHGEGQFPTVGNHLQIHSLPSHQTPIHEGGGIRLPPQKRGVLRLPHPLLISLRMEVWWLAKEAIPPWEIIYHRGTMVNHFLPLPR